MGSLERAKTSVNFTIVSKYQTKILHLIWIRGLYRAYWDVLGVLEYQFRFYGAFGLKGVEEPLILVVSNCVLPIVIGRLRVSN